MRGRPSVTAIALRYRIGLLGALLGALVLPLGTNGGTATAQAKRCSTVVAAKRTCLRIGQRCTPAYKADYLLAGYACTHRKKRWILTRAGEAALRHGELVILQANGRPTFDRAKQVFAKLIAPLPGVRIRPGVVGESDDGTPAIGWLWDYRDRLTPSQRAVLERVLTPLPNAFAFPALFVPGLSVPEAWDNLVQEARRRFDPYGVRFNHPIVTRVSETPMGTDAANAVGQWLYGMGNNCLVTLTPAGAKSIGTPTAYYFAAHEAFHCAEDEYGRGMPWVEEGLAAWAGSVVASAWVGQVPAVATHYAEWLGPSDVPLFSRSYDGIGFWALLRHAGANPFSLVGPATLARTSTAAYAAATQGVGSSAAFPRLWGTGLASFPVAGSEWDTTGPGNPHTSPLHRATVDNGDVYTHAIAAHAGWAEYLDIQADIVITHNQGAVATFEPSGHPKIDLEGAQYFCTRTDGCKCPGGASPGYTQIDQGAALLGYASVSGSAGVSVIGQSVDQACGKKNPPKKKPRPLPRGGIEIHGPVPITQRIPAAVYVRFTSARCTKGTSFHAVATAGGPTLNVTLAKYHGGDDYTVPYAGGDPRIVFKSPKGTFSNNAPPPYDQLTGFLLIPKTQAGLAISHLILFDGAGKTAVSVVGSVPCIYPKPKP